MTQDDFQKLLRVFKVVADERRLRLIGLLAGGERTVDELASLLGIKAPTVSHHLAKLKELDLVGMRVEGNNHVYRLRGECLTELSRDLLTRERLGAIVSDMDTGEWGRKVLRDFFEGDRLKAIPAARKKRDVVLRWLATRFEPGVRYPERDVNALLERHHWDSATLRRELVGMGLLRRERGTYWRVG